MEKKLHQVEQDEILESIDRRIERFRGHIQNLIRAVDMLEEGRKQHGEHIGMMMMDLGLDKIDHTLWLFRHGCDAGKQEYDELEKLNAR